MKKGLILILFSLLVSGCSDRNNETTVSDETVENEQAAIQELSENDGSVVRETADYKGYVLVYNDVVIEIDSAADSVLEQLGEPNSYFEAPSCAFDGIDKIYTYNSFELDTYPLDGEDFISSVLFKDDTVTTMEGIGIGDSVEKLTETYGGDSIQENGMTVYCKDDMKLCFITEGDFVSSIEYKTTILDE